LPFQKLQLPLHVQGSNLAMEQVKVIETIKRVARDVLPKGSSLYLYGSRARGDYHEDSDWDLLLLLDKPKREDKDFANYAYPIMEQGFDMWQYFSVHTYTKDEWYNSPHSMFYFNVEQDKKLLYES
jgi:predicted nucleotidyltransferase